jgi:hypothetical protein
MVKLHIIVCIYVLFLETNKGRIMASKIISKLIILTFALY